MNFTTGVQAGDEAHVERRRGETLESGDVRLVFLDGSEPAEREAWLQLWRRWPSRETMAHPGYVRLFARPGDQVICASATTRFGGVLYPVIVRPLSSEPWAGPETPGCDLTTAYGYGGPFAWNITRGEALSFWSQFEGWARSRGVVTEFARLSLFPEQTVPFHGGLLGRGQNVVRDLGLEDGELWADYEGKVRKNVKRARQEGVSVTFDTSGERLDDFIRVYESTMSRREALRLYYFPRSFFEAIIAELPGQFVFAHAVVGGSVVSSELLLLSVERAYSYLGGTLAEAFSKRPKDLLQHEIVRYCRDRGLAHLVLGGGYRPEDGILKFKRSFAPGGDRPFHVGVMTYDQAASSRLVERRREWERAQGREWNPVNDYFPSYRS